MGSVLPAMHPVKSSNIEAIGHDAGKHELHVKFKGSGTYVYAGVHRDIFAAMLHSGSVGKYHADHIKDVFKHRKL